MNQFTYLGQEVIIGSAFKNDHIYKAIKNAKTFYELRLLEKIRRLNLTGTYLDIGANIGNHSIYFSKFCKAEKVIAFEILEDLCRVFQKNIMLNSISNCELCHFGLSNKDESVSLNPIDETNIGMTSIKNVTGEHEVKRLDSLNLTEKISLIKIDVEGFEAKVIQGATQTILKNKPVIISESRNEKEFLEQQQILNQLGYNTDKINYASTPTYIWTAN